MINRVSAFRKPLLTSAGQSAARECESVGRTLAKRQKKAVEETRNWRHRALATLLPGFALLLTGATLFNVFVQQAAAPARAVAQNDGPGQAGPSQRTLILHYDETVEDVQRELQTAGFFKGQVDGVAGPQTKVAVEDYQRANELDVTGQVSPALLDHIRYTKKLAAAAKFTGSIAPAPITPVAPAATANATPVPVFKPEQTTAQPSGAFLDLQEQLARLGYDPGTRSGQLDEATRSAILIFQMDHGMPMDGKVSKALLGALKQAESKLSANQ